MRAGYSKAGLLAASSCEAQTARTSAHGRLFAGENLKMKRTFARKLIWLCPVLVLALSFGLAGAYLYQCAFNWWYLFFLPLQAALICTLVNQKEEKQLKYYPVYSAPLPLRRVWGAKVMLSAVYLLLSAFLFALLCSGITLLLSGGPVSAGGGLGGAADLLPGQLLFVGESVAAAVVAVLCSVWMAPLYLWLGKRSGFFWPVAACLVSFAAEIICSGKSWWWLCPPAWTSRLMCPMLGILPNGLPAAMDDPLRVGPGSIILTCICSVFLFLVLTAVTAADFQKRREER